MPDVTQDRYNRIATRAVSGGRVGFSFGVIVEIISIAMPAITRLLDGCGEDSPKQVATKHYDSATDTFRDEAIRRMRPEMRRAARKANREDSEKRKATPAELDAMAEATLREALESDDETVKSFVMAVKTNGTETDGAGT